MTFSASADGTDTHTSDVCGVEVTEHDHVAVTLPHPSGVGFTIAEGYLCDTHLEQAQRNVARALGGEASPLSSASRPTSCR